MKKLFSILLVIIVLSMVAAPVVLASGHVPGGLGGIPTEGIPVTGDELVGRIGDIGNWIFVIFMAMSVIYILLGAFQFITAGGDPAKLSEARQKLIFAAIGIAISLLAAGFDDILRNILLTDG